MFKRFVSTVSGLALLAGGLLGVSAPALAASYQGGNGTYAVTLEPFQENRPRYTLGRSGTAQGGFEAATSEYFRVNRQDHDFRDYQPPAVGETLWIQEEETNVTFKYTVSKVREYTNYFNIDVEETTKFVPPHNTFIRLGEPLNPAAPTDRPLVFAEHDSEQPGSSKNGQMETFKVTLYNPTGIKGGLVEASLDGVNTLVSAPVEETDEPLAEVFLQSVLKDNMQENSVEFTKVSFSYLRNDGLESTNNTVDVWTSNTPEGSFHYDTKKSYSVTGGLATYSEYLRVADYDLGGSQFGPFEVGDSIKWRKLDTEDWIEKEITEVLKQTGYWKYSWEGSVSWTRGSYEFREVGEEPGPGIPLRVENLASDEDGNESYTQRWVRYLADDCEDRNFAASGECDLGIVELTGSVWDETLRFVYASDAEAESIDAIYFEDSAGAKVSGALTLATGVNDPNPKVHVIVPGTLKAGMLEISVEVGGEESPVGKVNRVVQSFDLKQDESLEVSEKQSGVADYWCEPVYGSASSLRFDDVDFDNTCASYQNGTPGLALPYQVYQMEETAKDTFRFKPHCLGDFKVMWGNRLGKDSERTYGCVPPIAMCEAYGGSVSQYDNGYGVMTTYCDLSAEVAVSLSGPSEVAVGETVTYEVMLTSTDRLKAGSLSLTSKDAVVGSVQVPAGGATSLYSFTLTADVEQEVSSPDDLIYPLQAFYDVPHTAGDDDRYESSVLVVTVIPEPDMCEVLRPEMLPATPKSIDIDGDGVPNAQDTDIDGDGVSNVQDGDIDGDGTPNIEDGDIDGDGTPNKEDTTPEGPPSRPVHPNFWEENQQQELADKVQEHVYGENYPSTFPLPVDPDSGEEETFADGAGLLVPAPSYEMVVEVLNYSVDDACGIDTDWDGNGGGSPEKPTDPGTGGGTDTNTGAYPILGDGGTTSANPRGVSLRLIVPSEVYKGVEAELGAQVDANDGKVEFAVREVDLEGNQSARVIGSSEVNDEGYASIMVTPEDYGDATVYARYTGEEGVDTAAAAVVVNPAPFIDDLALRVGGNLWTEIPKGEVLPYGYNEVDYTTSSGEAPRVEVEGPCQVLSTRSIPPQVKILGTASAPSRCKVTVSTGGSGAYSSKTWVYDVANAMGNQTAKLKADKSNGKLKVGSKKVLATPGQSMTDANYRLTGKEISWRVSSGKDFCSVSTSSSGKVTVKGLAKGSCTVEAFAPKVKSKYKSFKQTYDFSVR